MIVEDGGERYSGQALRVKYRNLVEGGLQTLGPPLRGQEGDGGEEGGDAATATGTATGTGIGVGEVEAEGEADLDDVDRELMGQDADVEFMGGSVEDVRDEAKKAGEDGDGDGDRVGEARRNRDRDRSDETPSKTRGSEVSVDDGHDESAGWVALHEQHDDDDDDDADAVLDAELIGDD